MVEARVPARAALAGNPSDGYGGCVVAVPIPGLGATVTAAHADGVILDVAGQGRRTFLSLDEALDERPVCDGPGLLHAALRRACGAGVEITDGVELRAATSIPTEVGLASSSALVIAALRALETPLGTDALAHCALAAETDDLGIAAGLQDRLVQAYGVPLHMNFATGVNEPITGVIGELLLAWQPAAAARSGVLHGDLRSRYDRGDPTVTTAMPALAGFADQASDAIAAADGPGLGAAMNASFDSRVAMGASDATTMEMVAAARASGAAANSAGSGGAIVCCGPGLDSAEQALREAGCATMRIL